MGDLGTVIAAYLTDIGYRVNRVVDPTDGDVRLRVVDPHSGQAVKITIEEEF